MGQYTQRESLRIFPRILLREFCWESLTESLRAMERKSINCRGVRPAAPAASRLQSLAIYRQTVTPSHWLAAFEKETRKGDWRNVCAPTVKVLHRVHSLADAVPLYNALIVANKKTRIKRRTYFGRVTEERIRKREPQRECIRLYKRVREYHRFLVGSFQLAPSCIVISDGRSGRPVRRWRADRMHLDNLYRTPL